LLVPGIAAAQARPPLKDVSAVRLNNYGAPSRLFDKRDQVAPIVEELNALRAKRWKKGDTKLKCYATVVLMSGSAKAAEFRVSPEYVVERPLEKGESSYSLAVTQADRPQIAKLLGEVPASKKCT
jgi:hypothetical protein